MSDKLNPKMVSLSLVSISVVVSLVCALLIALFPEATLKFFGSIFHGIDMTKIAVSVTFSGVLMGLVAIIIISLITGWLFAVVYNYLEEKLI